MSEGVKKLCVCSELLAFPTDALLTTDHKYVHMGKICMLLEWKINISTQGNVFWMQ